MLQLNKIHNLDVLEGLKQLEDESIDCVMTSPPYWALRDYGIKPSIWDGDKECEHEFGSEIKAGENYTSSKRWQHTGGRTEEFKTDKQISQGNFCLKCNAWKGNLGLEPTFELFIKHLCDIFDEIKRVLKKTGTCWVNLGDTYSGSGAGQKDTGKAVYNGEDFRKKPTKTYLQDKSLCQIPSRFAIEMSNRGWILRNELIWHKPNCMPSSAKDRFTVDFEKIFFFVKNKKYFFETQYEDIAESSMKDKRRGKIEYDGKWAKGSTQTMGKQKSFAYIEEGGRNKRAVWKITTQPFPEAHFGVYPEKLCETPIKSGCPIDGIVLDPFAGAGTTCLVARKLQRQFIGFEINPDYIKIANKRLKPFMEQKSLMEVI